MFHYLIILIPMFVNKKNCAQSYKNNATKRPQKSQNILKRYNFEEICIFVQLKE